MAITYVCSMDHYGPSGGTKFGGGNNQTSGWELDNDVLLGDGWSSLPEYLNDNFRFGPGGLLKIEAPPWGARQGDYALVADGLEVWNDDGSGATAITQTVPAGASTRLVIPGDSNHVRNIHLAFGISELPFEVGHGFICHFLDSNGAKRASLRVDSSGRLHITTGGTLSAKDGADPPYLTTPAVLLTSSGPVITAQTWYYLSIKITTNADDTNADVQVYVGDISSGSLVLSGTGLGFSNTAASSNTIDIIGFLPASLSNEPFGQRDTTLRAVRDIVLTDQTAPYNVGLLGQVFVSAQAMRTEDDEGTNWTSHARKKIGDGILDHATNRTGLRFADAASLGIGTSDFTLESFVRFNALAGSERSYLVTKWRDEAGKRSYRLYYDGSTDRLIWEASTTGSDTVVVKAVPWVPQTGYWYHVAVSRSSSQTMFFINGEQLGVPVADANTYFAGTERLGVGVVFDSDGVASTTGRLNGWLDETRFTIGVARYTTDFAVPTAAFGRDSGADSDFASVVLLLGYNNETIADESGFGRAVTLGTPAVTSTLPQDGEFSYQTLNNRPPWDDTFIEAALTPAEGLFTFEEIPTADETLTLGAQTYTWVSAFSGAPADEVLIGADIDECVDNIIAAINAGAGEGTVYGTGTVANADAGAVEFLSPQFKVQALTAGAAGNSLASTDTMVDGFFNAATLTGGQDIPDPSDFAIERLPLDVSGVLGVQMTARAFKTEAGTSTIRFDLVGPSAGVAEGDEKNADLNPAWTRQVFEEDPDTSAGITPSTLLSGRARFVRSG